jgi:hypothetical protein
VVLVRLEFRELEERKDVQVRKARLVLQELQACRVLQEYRGLPVQLEFRELLV